MEREDLKKLLVRMVGELKLSKSGMRVYLQALKDFDVINQEDFGVFENYMNSNLSRLEIVEIIAHRNDKSDIVSKIKELWRRDEKTFGSTKMFKKGKNYE